MNHRACPCCGIIDRPRLMKMERTNGTLIYRYKCARCTTHTMWCVNEKAAKSLWDKGDVEK